MVSRSRIAGFTSKRLLVRSSCRSDSTSCRPGCLQALEPLIGQNANLVAQVLFELGNVPTPSISLGPSFSWPLAAEDAHVHHRASMPGGQVSEASRTSPAFSPKMARSNFFPESVESRPWGHLGHQNVAVLI